MKKHTKINLIKRILFILLIFPIVYSCDKAPSEIQEFDDIFDTNGVNELNLSIENAASADEVLALFSDADVSVPNELQNISLDEMTQHLESSLRLSSDEIDMLLKNDSKTYIEVLDRVGTLPEGIPNMEFHYNQLASSGLSKYLIKMKSAPESFYSDDYYSALVDLNNFVEVNMIDPMQPLKSATDNQNAINSAFGTRYYSCYKYISWCNFWYIWWTYWSDCYNNKHEGASGSSSG